jgi:OOP family OmpA-OmpF porin
VKFSIRRALLAVGGAVAGTVLAQSPPMKVGDVNEAAIIDALVVPEPMAASGPHARGFTLASPARKAHDTARPPSASVLITFVSDSAELTPESRQALDVIARAMAGDKLGALSFIVEGHADPRGGADHNMELSRRRADSVVDFLVNEHGIDRQRLVAEAKGSSEPLNTRQVDAPENRRVVFITRTN